VVVPIECNCVTVDGIDHDELATREAGGFDDRAQGSHEELGAKALTMEMLAEGQLGKQNRWDLARRSAPQLFRCLTAVKHVGHDREVARHCFLSIQ